MEADYVPSAREQARSRRSSRFEKEYIEGDEVPPDAAEFKPSAMDGKFATQHEHTHTKECREEGGETQGPTNP